MGGAWRDGAQRQDISDGWKAWRSSAGRYWATRTRNRVKPPGAPAEWALTVDGDTPEDLRAEIARQDAVFSFFPDG